MQERIYPILKDSTMISMQYVVTLPTDYDMEIIRNRVAKNGRLTDSFPGLNFKAYLMAEKGKNGANENRYAPFYLWNSHEGMNEFIMGGYFSNIPNSFGWQKICHWTPVNYGHTEVTDAPLFAVLENIPITPFADLKEVREIQTQWFDKCIATCGVHTCLVGLDPYNWTLVRMVLTIDAPVIEDTTDCYEVLHMSFPGR